jgi:hypothetical protein
MDAKRYTTALLAAALARARGQGSTQTSAGAYSSR